jgi:hypothetical protein
VTYRFNGLEADLKTTYPAALALILSLVCAPALAAANIGINELLSFVVYIVILGLIFWILWWALAYFAIPEPFNKIVRVVVGLICLVVVINLLLGLIGSPMFTMR